ncbi:murein biosynthesis integral membrane protein MurJ [uncultured Piscinibacter sp.]|uniref:murein biosynthesis integral membrane protein MurJ n=1 Tax=uncultured Piscinibacter sp. TaxID=1131835 RepID=UPI00262ABF83|nr:murein biosynthesis integral membrane protein MurJ [uncultured Piscinibacter sp.]
MNLLRAASTVSLFTLASRITGLAREAIVAAIFGASGFMDAFQVAFRIPNLLRRLFAEGAFSQAFVPILAETRAREGDEVTRRLIDAVATVLFWALLVTCALGIVASPVVIWLIASGLEQFDAAVVMTRWMFPYIGFMSMVAFAAGILNTWKRFALPAATPVLLNVAVIAAAWLLTPVLRRHGIEPIYALALGVMAGGVLQLGLQIPALARIGCLPRVGLGPRALREAFHHPGVLRVLKQMAPALLGVSVAQLSLLINTQIASHQGVGAVSWLTYADRLMEFPTALLGVALGVVLLPQLSAAQATGEAQRYSGLLDWGLRLVLMLALPCAVALLVFPKALVSVLYHYGAITPRDVERTASALMGYGVGLLGLIGVKILAPGFYARQDIRTPVRIAIVVLVLTQLMNLAFVPWLGHAGLALSIGLGALINAGWLFVGLRRAELYTPEPGWLPFALRVLLANALMGALLVWAAQSIDWIGLRAQPWTRVAALAGCIAAAMLLYFACLLATGLKLRQFIRRG